MVEGRVVCGSLVEGRVVCGSVVEGRVVCGSIVEGRVVWWRSGDSGVMDGWCGGVGGKVKWVMWRGEWCWEGRGVVEGWVV